MFCGNIFAVCAGTVKTRFLTVLFLLLPDGLKRDDHLFTFSIRFFRLFQSGYFSITILFRDFDWQMLYPHAVFSFLRIFLKKTDIQNYIELIYLLFTIWITENTLSFHRIWEHNVRKSIIRNWVSKIKAYFNISGGCIWW